MPHPVEEDLTTLVPRVKSFTNQYVTKAYATDEAKISSLSALVFDNGGKLIDIQSGSTSVTINKTMLSSPENKEKLTAATIVMFANVDLANVKNASGTSIAESRTTLTLDNIGEYTCHFAEDKTVITSLGDGFTGFPMMGQVTGVNLTSTATQQSAIEVALKILYAKINFSVSVENGTENTGTGMSFTLNGYSVHNVSKATTLAEPIGATLSDDYTTSGKDGNASGTVIIGGTPLTFTCYIAESRYDHNSNLRGIYPSDDWLTSIPGEDVKNYNAATDEGKVNGVRYFYDELIQQYKPKLAELDEGKPGKGKAAYVLINGNYIDYRGEVWTVNYKVYLGKDNAHNFHVDRNSEYTNHITIKGIRNNDSYGDNSVWVDHRVNVSSTDGPAEFVSITRETLIDSHIEVRPLRVKLAGSGYTSAAIYLPEYPIDGNGNVIYDNTTNPSSWSQLDEIMGGANENWIAIENNNGSMNKGRIYCSNGKRKYFTTSLMEELHAESTSIKIDSNGNKYISMSDNDCAWIYFDENATANTRRARVRVVFYSEGGSASETYDVYQSGYASVGNLNFENYEEYLHSYDYDLNTSITDYTQTGLSWGFEDDPISKNMLVSPMELASLGSLDSKDYIPSDVRYDYFHQNDGSSYFLYTHNGNSWQNGEFGTGLDFTNRAANTKKLTVTDMGTLPLSAYEYCLSKNKFHEDAEGNHTMIIRWYLPDVYELNSLFSDSNTTGDMAKDAYYWSSQPTSRNYGFDNLPVIGNVSIKTEVTDQARAVSKSGVADIDRTYSNRIRCFYDKDGLNADMSDRVPNGLGGIIKVPMKAYLSHTATNTAKGYFSAWLSEIVEDPQVNTPSLPSYAFPTGTDAEALDHFVSNGVYYYEKDPTTSGAWQYSSIIMWDNTLYNYPGLTKKEVVSAGGLESLKFIESSEDKVYERSVSEVSGEQIVSLPSNDQLATKPLDHMEGTDILNISFSNGTNSSEAPSYSYRREELSSTIYRRYWNLPTYTTTNVNESTGSTVKKVQTNVVTYGLTSVGDDYDYNGVTHTVTRKYTEGGFLSRKYYFDLGPKTVNRSGWKYVSGGGWGAEQSYPETSTNLSGDKLELFGGNSFTISAKEGWRIVSIRVNFSDDNGVNNILGDLIDISYRNLRLVDGNQTLPTTSAPDYMSYSGDGESGWFQWKATTVDDYASSVTLKLVAYVPAEGTNILRPTAFQYDNPTRATGYQSDLETSIVIDSFEIRVEEVQ